MVVGWVDVAVWLRSGWMGRWWLDGWMDGCCMVVSMGGWMDVVWMDVGGWIGVVAAEGRQFLSAFRHNTFLGLRQRSTWQIITSPGNCVPFWSTTYSIEPDRQDLRS